MLMKIKMGGVCSPGKSKARSDRMRLIKANTETQYGQIQALYMRAFPAVERKPFPMMLEKQKEGSMELLFLEEDGAFLGLAIFVLDADLVLLDYFAIEENCRDQGIGSKALALLQQYYPGRRLLLEIEDAAAPTADQQMRIRRKGFYLRNGMTVMPFLVNLFSVEMEVLTYHANVTYEEYVQIYEHVFGEKIRKHVTLVRRYD